MSIERLNYALTIYSVPFSKCINIQQWKSGRGRGKISIGRQRERQLLLSLPR